MFKDNYKNLLSYYEKNKEKPWNEWLVFDKLLEKPGKQGVVGIFKSKTKNNEEEPLKYVFKMSQNLNFLVQHESSIMKGLTKISEYCPYFCRGIGIIKALTEPDRTSKKPFNIKSKFPIALEKVCNLLNKIVNYVFQKV